MTSQGLRPEAGPPKPRPRVSARDQTQPLALQEAAGHLAATQREELVSTYLSFAATPALLIGDAGVFLRPVGMCLECAALAKEGLGMEKSLSAFVLLPQTP